MNFIDRIKAKAWRRPAFVRKELSRNNVITFAFDQRKWRDRARVDKRVNDDITDLYLGDMSGETERKGYDNAPELMRDLWMCLYKADPKLEHPRNVRKDARLNRKIIEEMLASPNMEELRELTMLDETLSTMALANIVPAVKEILLRHQEEAEQANEEKRQGGHKGGDQGGEPGEGQGAASGGNPGGEEGEGESLAGAHANGEEGGDLDEEEREFDVSVPEGAEEHEGEFEMDADLEAMLHAAMDNAQEELKGLEEVRKGVGLEDGEWKRMSPEQRIAMANSLDTPQMKALADIVGRMKRFAIGVQATKLIDVPHEAYDVTTGDNIRDALGSEFALMDDEDTEWEFYRRFLEKEMLQYKKHGKEDAGKGPIIICIDKSGSMHGTPFNWAMGVAEALRRICVDQERDYYAMFFGSNNDRERFDFPMGKAPFEKVMEFLSTEANGGTQFDGVLSEALARVSEEFGKGRERSDVVFLTDGQAHLDQAWLDKFNEEKKRVGCRVFGVFVGGAYDYYGDSGTKVLEGFSDGVINVKDLKPESVEAIFAAV